MQLMKEKQDLTYFPSLNGKTKFRLDGQSS